MSGGGARLNGRCLVRGNRGFPLLFFAYASAMLRLGLEGAGDANGRCGSRLADGGPRGERAIERGGPGLFYSDGDAAGIVSVGRSGRGANRADVVGDTPLSTRSSSSCRSCVCGASAGSCVCRLRVPFLLPTR